MKFNGEIKFPDVDHPGVPAQIRIEDLQIELVLEGESLGRWSLYDVHARRLVSSAFSIDLDGTEVTFVAEDPIDFAYRGVEHMAETWAAIKAKQIATRTLAVRKSRRGTSPSRLSELRSAMEENLSVHEPLRRIAGEPTESVPAAESPVPSGYLADVDFSSRFDADVPSTSPAAGPSPMTEDLASVESERLALEAERRRLQEEREALQRELREAEQREQDRITAFRIEMQRLEAERREMLSRLEAAGESVADFEDVPDVADVIASESVDTGVADPVAEVVEEPEADQAVEESVAVEPPRAEPIEEPLTVDVPETIDESAPEPVDESVEEPLDPEETVSDVAEAGKPEEPADLDEPDDERSLAPVGGPTDDPGDTSVLDLSDMDHGPNGEVANEELAPVPEHEPAMAGAARDSRSGLMGAVRAAFARGGGRTHEHQFVAAPGGLGITRWVCEECGYVSISVGED